MSRRGRRLTAALAGLVALLFVGRWTAGLLADRWWAAEISPAAVAFLTDWHILRLTLDLSGALVASAWFIGHLLLVHRAVGSVQVRRNVANLEFREALTPGLLLAVAVASGVLLGVLVGAGASGKWQEVALGWHGVAYGVGDPLLQHDLGLYLAQLPVWRAAHGFFLSLELLALGIVFGLYLVVGAVRWIEGRPAINNHARSHLGWLLAGLALALLWGYLLEPYELVAGPGQPIDRASWEAATLVAPLLAGVALATAGLSAAWAVRPRHALAAAGWIVLALASLVGHWIVPPALGGQGEPAVTPRMRERLDRLAYGMHSLEEVRLTSVPQASVPRVPSLWNPAMVTRLVAGDSVTVLAVDAAVLALQGRRRPVWLAARTLAGGRLSVSAIADDRVTPTGEPLFYRMGDSTPRPVAVPLVELRDDASRPGAPAYRVNSADGSGVTVGGWPRRVLLAWALQAGGVLGQLPGSARIDWRLSPDERLSRLTPFAQWGEAVPRMVEGELVWVADGYLASAVFPLSDRVVWRGKTVGALQAAFVGAVEARSGATRIYLRPGADDLAEAWSSVSRGVVEPAAALPEPLLRAAPYPIELFRVQARALEQEPWAAGSLGARSGPASSDPPRSDVGWRADTTGPLLLAGFERTGERRLGALLVGGREEGQDALRLVRLDSAVAPPSRGALESRWSNFASYDALTDSIRADGGTLDHGPVRLELLANGIGAYQVHFAERAKGRLAIAWVSVAVDRRMGAGRTLKDAWSNLLGASAPTIPGPAQATRLEEARRWLERADSSLRRADWGAFGRAWRELRRSLGLPADSVGT